MILSPKGACHRLERAPHAACTSLFHGGRREKLEHGNMTGEAYLNGGGAPTNAHDQGQHARMTKVNMLGWRKI